MVSENKIGLVFSSLEAKLSFSQFDTGFFKSISRLAILP